MMSSDISLNVFATAPEKKVTKKYGRMKQDKSKAHINIDKSNFNPKFENTYSKTSHAKKRPKYKESDESPKNKKRKQNFGDEKKGKVTSLWGGNPDIPYLPKEEKIKHENKSLFSDISFSNAGLHPFMVSNLEKILGSSKMTQVQQKSIPVLISGKDALVRSHTGSGKTLAYSVPIIQALQEIRPKIARSQGTLALVIVPTRELALQTYEWLIKLVKPFQWLVPGVLSGGEKKKCEKARMRKGVTILVSTPGRLLDHLNNTAVCSLTQVRYLVLDEADRMLDMGYEKDISSIVTKLQEQGSNPDQRQTMLLSATLNPGVERLAGLALKETRVFVDADSGDEENKEDVICVPESLEQWALVIPAKLRLVALSAFIAAKCELSEERKLLIFCATQDMVDYLIPLLAVCLSPQDTTEEDEEEKEKSDEEEDNEEETRTKIKSNITFFRLHGNMSQKDRMEVFKTFRDAHSGVLLCTDVASRGLDLPQVDWIVQYTAPQSTHDYVHRIGRTARIGAKGSAVIFLAPSETAYVSQLHKHGIRIKEMNAEKCLDYLLELVPQTDQQQRKRSRRKTWKPTVEGIATALQLRYETAVLNDKALHELACKAYVSFVRFYASFPKVPDQCFHYKALHLGHYAKSFALRDPPSAIGGIGKRSWERNLEQNSRKFQSGGKMSRNSGFVKDRTRELVVSEFASGL